MSRSTKLVVIASNLLAVWLVAELVSRGIPAIFFPALTAFAVCLAAAWLAGDVVTGLVLSTVYVMPAACFAWFHQFVFSYYAIWIAGLAGAMLPGAFGSKWAFPRRFAWPLILWALTIALSWPIAVLREADFAPVLLMGTGMRTYLPQPPGIIAVWISMVAAIAMTGLLLLDWIFLRYPADAVKRFERHVIWPMFGGAVLAAVVAVYQATVDISFLNQTFFQGLDRVVGTMRDANAFGAVAALWASVTAAMVLNTTKRSRATLGWVTALVILAIAVWASGSRTALLAMMVGLTVVAFHGRKRFPARQLIAGVAGALLVCATIVAVVPSTTVARAKTMLPGLSRPQLEAAAFQLWSRDMYGQAGMKMIAEHPFVGVGVGGFNYLVGEVLYRVARISRPPDNAQNWYRQQLAELGLLGSIGWLAWLAMFAWMLMRCPDGDGESIRAGGVKGAVLGLAAASLLGGPTQDTAASISLVVAMGWCVKLKRVEGSAPTPPGRLAPVLEWAAVLVILGAFLCGSVYAAQTEMRPAYRAFDVAFPYRYGFTVDAADPTLRWAGGRAVEVFPADKRWLKIVVGDVAPDAAEKPVRVRIWIDRISILDVRRRSSFPIERWVRMPDFGTPVIIEINVDRTWLPPNAAEGELPRGVGIREWSFVQDDPPKGSITLESLERPR